MLLAAAAVAFSCEKETSATEEIIVPEENVEILTINADAVAAESETKTALSGTTPSWAKDDQVSVVYTKTDASVATQASSKLAAASSTASFSVALTSPDAGEDAYAYYPANELAATSTTAKVVISDEQFPVGTSFDGDSDILVSDAFTPSGTVDAHFRRLGAVLRIKLSNAKINSEKLLNLSVTATNPLAGTVSVRLSDGVATGIESGSNTVTATYAAGDQFTLNADGKYVYLIVYPQTLASGSSLTFSGETENATFSKTISLSSNIVLNAGHIKPLSVAILDANITPKDKVFLEERWSETSGTGGNDLKWSGSISTNTIYYDGASWTLVSSGGANSCIKLGTGSTQGKATTPSIVIPTLYQSETLKLSFRSAAWSGDQTTLNLSATNATLSESSVTLKNGADDSDNWDAHTIDVTVTNTPVTIVFTAKQASKSRFFLDDVCLYYGTAPVEKANPGIAFSASEASAVALDDFTEPTFSNPNSLSPITWSSDDEDVATVDGSGNVTPKSEGTATITASFAGNASYKAKDVSYVLTVEAATLSASTPAKAAATENSTTTFTVTSNISWTATKGTDAENIIKSVSTVGNTVTVTFNGNTGVEKTAKVNITPSNSVFSALAKEVTVTQAAAGSSYEVTYTVTNKTAVSTTGTAPAGSSATYSQTYNTASQITKDNSITLTLTGFDGKKISGATASMKSNKSSGSGTMSFKSGDNTIASISSASAFNNAAWYGNWSTDYVDVVFDVTETTVGSGESVVFTISATENSLYFQALTITYE